MAQGWFDQNKPSSGSWFEANRPLSVSSPPKEEVKSGQNVLGRLWDAANKPMIEAPSRIGRDAAARVDPLGSKDWTGAVKESDIALRNAPMGMAAPKTGNPLGDILMSIIPRSMLAGMFEGAGDTASNFTSPLNASLLATGGGALATTGRTARNLRVASRVLSTPVVAHGTGEMLGADKALPERAFGLAETAGGLAGMYFPKAATPRIESTTPPKQVGPKLLPKGQTLHVSPEGVAGVPVDFTNTPSMRERLSGKREVIPRAVEPEPKTFEVSPEGKATEVTSKFEAPDWLPKFAREGTKTKLGANPEILGRILASGYKANMPKVVTKELLQNAVDATRHMGPLADIKISYGQGTEYFRVQEIQDMIKQGKTPDEWSMRDLERYKKSNPAKVEPFVEVSDNGPGLTREQIDTIYTDLGESGKRLDQEAVGGFGIAKASYLIGGKRVEVSTVARGSDGKLYEHSFSGTPEEILSGFEVNTKLAPEGTPTGTRTRTYFDKQDGFYSAKKFAKEIANYSTGRQGNLTVNVLENDRVSYSDTYKKPTIEGEPINLSDENADVELLVPKGSAYEERAGIDVKLLNNGMFQGEMHLGGYNTIPNVPEQILVNIKSKVAEGHTNYPFTMTREDLKGPIKAAVEKYIDENIIKPGTEARINAVKEAYNTITGITSGGKAVHYYDAMKKFTPEEMAVVQSSPELHSLGATISDVTREIIDIVDPSLNSRLDKIGLLFDQDTERLTHGIWIPNPGTDKAAILINPLGSITGLDFKTRTPYQAASAIHHTIMHEVNHFNAGAHDENFTSKLGRLYEEYGKRGFATELAAKQQIYRRLTGGGEGYLPEIQELLRVYQESRRRPGTTDDPLYRTGIKSADSQPPREKKVSGNSQRNPEATTAASVKLLEGLKAAIPLRTEQNAIYSAERSERFKKFLQIKQGGRKGAEASLSQLKGEMEKVIQSPIQLTDTDTTLLFDAVKYSPIITPGEKARGFTALMKLIDGGPVLQPNEIQVLDRVFGGQFGSQLTELYGGIGAVGVKLSKGANTMKTLMSAADLSAPFRQGLGLVTRKEFWKAFMEMPKLFGSETAYRATMDSIETHPNYILSREHGLFMAGEDLAGREEQFLESYISDLAKMGKTGKILTGPVRASERAYTGFLNKLRFDTFNSMIDNLTKAGYTADQVAPAIAKYVNVSTGRGDLGRFNRYSGDLNLLLFSPRLIASRLTVLNPKYYVDAPPYMRMQALRTLAGIAGTVVIANSVGSLLGGDKTLNPTSSDFGKIKFGRTRLDPGGGFLQYIVLFARMLSNQTTTSVGRTYDMSKGGWNTPNRWSLLAGSSQQPGFIESKGSPAATLVTSMLRGKNFAGQPLDIPAELRNRFIPIFMQDINDLYKSDPELIPFLAPLAATGMGVQTHDVRQPQMQLGVPGFRSLRP